MMLRGDSRVVMARMNSEMADLVMTSPPYADARKGQYGGPAPDAYVGWFLGFSLEVKRLLREDGTFILNIKEKVVNGERHPYVLHLILALREQGWLWTEEFIWHKRNSVPGKWPNRFRDSWERCLQFNKSKNFYMDQDAVKVPVGDWSWREHNTASRKSRGESATGSSFGVNRGRWIGKQTVYPANVLSLATVCRNTGHSAAFPDELPEFFIKLFSRKGGVVIDPFAGSGTTVRVAQR